MFVDPLICKLQNVPTHVHASADDVIVTAVDRNPGTVCGNMKRAIDRKQR